MENNICALMERLETKIRIITPYLCRVMRASYAMDVICNTPVQFTIDMVEGTMSIKEVFFRISEYATLIAKNGELEFVYNENGEDSCEHIIFKTFNDWEDFLKDEVSI